MVKLSVKGELLSKVLHNIRLIVADIWLLIRLGIYGYLFTTKIYLKS